MSLVRTASCIAFAGLALAACSKPAGKAASGAPAASSAASAPAQRDELGPEIPADKLPALKAGLWETTVSTAGRPPRAERHCESGAQKPITMGKECSKLTLHRTLLGKYVLDSQCGYGEMAFGMHVEAAGDFSSHYSADITSHVKLPGKPDEVDTSHHEGRYLGPCPAGMSADG
jgi:hypothetical protein